MIESSYPVPIDIKGCITDPPLESVELYSPTRFNCAVAYSYTSSLSYVVVRCKVVEYVSSCSTPVGRLNVFCTLHCVKLGVAL